MQVNNLQSTPPPVSPTESPPEPREAVREAPAAIKPAIVKENSARILKSKLAEAAGLKPAEANGVRVALAVDKESNRLIARVINKDSGEVLFQIPSE